MILEKLLPAPLATMPTALSSPDALGAASLFERCFPCHQRLRLRLALAALRDAGTRTMRRLRLAIGISGERDGRDDDDG